MSRPRFSPITIQPCRDEESSDSCAWEVLQDGKTSGALCFGEMLELVVKLVNPGTPGPVYGMRTREEWDALHRAWKNGDFGADKTQVVQL